MIEKNNFFTLRSSYIINEKIESSLRKKNFFIYSNVSYSQNQDKETNGNNKTCLKFVPS